MISVFRIRVRELGESGRKRRVDFEEKLKEVLGNSFFLIGFVLLLFSYEFVCEFFFYVVFICEGLFLCFFVFFLYILWCLSGCFLIYVFFGSGVEVWFGEELVGFIE